MRLSFYPSLKMSNKNKLYALFGALVLVLAVVVFANMNGSLLQGNLRYSAETRSTTDQELKISPVTFERTVSRIDVPIEIAGFSTDRALKIQAIDLKIAPAGFAIDQLYLYKGKTNLQDSLDQASIDFMTCPHCGFARGEDIEAKIRFTKPIEMNSAEDVFLVEMKTKAVDSREGSLESEITGITEVLADGSIKIHPASDLDYIIRPETDLREEDYTIEESDLTLTADSNTDRERVRESGETIDLAGFTSDASYTLESFTIEIEAQGGASVGNVSVWIDDEDVTLEVDADARDGSYTYTFKEPKRIDAGSSVRIRADVSDDDDVTSGTITAGVTEVRESEEGRSAVRMLDEGEIEYTVRLEASSTIESEARELEYTFDDSSTTLSAGSTTDVR